MVQDVSTEYAIRGVTSVQETGLIACYGIFDVLPKVLDEMQEVLEVRRGTIAGSTTIYETLKRSGYSMKKVCPTRYSC